MLLHRAKLAGRQLRNDLLISTTRPIICQMFHSVSRETLMPLPSHNIETYCEYYVSKRRFLMVFAKSWHVLATNIKSNSGRTYRLLL